MFDTMVTQYGTDYANALEQANIDYDQSGNLIREEEGEVTSGPNVVDNAKLESRLEKRVTEKSLEIKLDEVNTLEDFTEFVKQPFDVNTYDKAVDHIDKIKSYSTKIHPEASLEINTTS